MNLITIGVTADGWLSVRVVSATEMTFEFNPGKEGISKAIEKTCRIVPTMIRLDGDLMEAFDDAGRTKPKTSDINAVKIFAESFKFRKVDCALPGFDQIK